YGRAHRASNRGLHTRIHPPGGPGRRPLVHPDVGLETGTPHGNEDKHGGNEAPHGGIDVEAVPHRPEG
ncbi:MAG TPA: hypothetical protein VHP11_15120, partial [Tepidisphaeraceae bacterium]|nr:hypothetical protein [Tepidisphaeraceae bacterium]